jgi:LysM repeat protein
MNNPMSNLKRILVLVCVITLLWAGLGTQAAWANSESTYVVQPGDTLTDIAARHRVSVSQLVTANDLSADAWVFAGQQLAIPTSESRQQAITLDTIDKRAFLVDRRVPDPLPQQPTLPKAQPINATHATYARVIQDDTPVYSHPGGAALGLPPKRTLGVGFVWVSVQGQTTYEGYDYFQINPGEYVSAEALSFYRPSAFQGVALADQPERPFAWILQTVQPLLTPEGESNPDAPVYQRYDLVQIFAEERLGDQVNQVWYLIGPDQWINQTYVGKVTPSVPPEGVASDAAWVEVNLFEQTLAAYVGDRIIYATLVSTGLPGWGTPVGLSQVWLKVPVGKMSGGYDRPDYYFLEDVRWTMYFNRDVALHSAYWHDGFGYKHSHGCVNLAPMDARWLFEWAPENLWVLVRDV